MAMPAPPPGVRVMQVGDATIEVVDPIADIINTLLLWGIVAGGIVAVAVIGVQASSIVREELSALRRQF